MLEYIIDLLIEFDEMGFIPTTTCPDPEGYAKEWKNKILSAVRGLRWHTIQEVIDDVDDMIGGKKIAQDLREIYLEKE